MECFCRSMRLLDLHILQRVYLRIPIFSDNQEHNDAIWPLLYGENARLDRWFPIDMRWSSSFEPLKRGKMLSRSFCWTLGCRRSIPSLGYYTEVSNCRKHSKMCQFPFPCGDCTSQFWGTVVHNIHVLATRRCYRWCSKCINGHKFWWSNSWE